MLYHGNVGIACKLQFPQRQLYRITTWLPYSANFLLNLTKKKWSHPAFNKFGNHIIFFTKKKKQKKKQNRFRWFIQAAVLLPMLSNYIVESYIVVSSHFVPCFCHLITPHVSDLWNELRSLPVTDVCINVSHTTEYIYVYTDRRQNTDRKYWNSLRVDFVIHSCCVLIGFWFRQPADYTLSQVAVDLHARVREHMCVPCASTTRDQLTKHWFRCG